MPDKELRMPAPNEKQALALGERHRYVAYGGARGGGKSWFVRWKAVLLCLRFPGIKVLITRRTYKELFNNHIAPLQQMLGGIAEYKSMDKYFRFPGGSTIHFGYCACDGDLGQYQGAEYDVWFADEAGQFQESWLVQIDACVRGVNGFPKRTYYTLNPGGPGHGYFKRLFIDRRYTENEHPEDYAVIQALCTDNQALMASQPGYLRSLEKLPGKLRQAWLYGRWDVYEGQFFEEFTDDPRHYADRRFSHVIDPFEIPAGWKIYRSFDWGYHRPFSFQLRILSHLRQFLYQCPSLAVICFVPEADPDGTLGNSPGAFVGQRSAVESRPDGNAPFAEIGCDLLTVPLALEGHSPRLVLPGKDPEAQIAKIPG